MLLLQKLIYLKLYAEFILWNIHSNLVIVFGKSDTTCMVPQVLI